MMSRSSHRFFLSLGLIALTTFGGVIALWVIYLQEPSRHVETTADRALHAQLKAGRTYRSTLIEGPASAHGAEIVLGFRSDLIDSSVGCNDMSGPSVVDDNRLVQYELISTAKLCPSLDRQERWLAELLREGVDFSLNGERLILGARDVRIELRADVTAGVKND